MHIMLFELVDSILSLPVVLNKLIIEYVPVCYNCKLQKNTVYKCGYCDVWRCKYHRNINSCVKYCVECAPLVGRTMQMHQHINKCIM